MSAAQERTAIKILDGHRTMAISTVRPDRWPQTTVVGYANVGLLLYFLIFRSSQKFANIAKDNRVSVAVAPEPRDLSVLQAVYAGASRQRSPMTLSARRPGSCSCSVIQTWPDWSRHHYRAPR